MSYSFSLFLWTSFFLISNMEHSLSFGILWSILLFHFSSSGGHPPVNRFLRSKPSKTFEAFLAPHFLCSPLHLITKTGLPPTTACFFRGDLIVFAPFKRLGRLHHDWAVQKNHWRCRDNGAGRMSGMTRQEKSQRETTGDSHLCSVMRYLLRFSDI